VSVTTHLSTQAVHAGEDKRKPYGSLTTPIVQTSTYTFEDTAEILEFMRRKTARNAGADLVLRDEYGRYSNPTQSAAERKLAALEGGERALLFATGMAAITTSMLALLSSGDHVVMAFDCYRRTREFATTFLKRWGIEATLISFDRPEALAGAVQPNTRLIFCESPTNPYLRVVDLAQMIAVARERGIITMIDSTFATPVNVRPLAYGVDLVVHSASKYLAGHNDLLAGAVIGARAILDRIELTRGVLGGVGGPNDAYLLLRGLKTLDLRVRRQNENAMRVARYLEGHPAVERVHYPGLSSHPDYEVARRQMSGFGGVVSFEIRGGQERASHFVDRLRLPYIGPTLGGVESIAQQQALFVSLDPVERRAAGLRDNLVRYAVGIEDVEDLIDDLAQALDGI
jgi:cystathionine gamma-synthase